MLNDENIYLKLKSIPKVAILDCLRKNLGDELLLRILAPYMGEAHSFDEISTTNFDAQVLIDLGIQYQGLSPEDVVELNEEYRYRGMKTLYILSYPLDDQVNIDTILTQSEAELEHALASIDIDDLKGYSALRIRDVDDFTVNNERLWEIVYCYTAPVQLLDPETEFPIESKDLRFGFIWVNRDTPWLVISAKDEVIAKKLISILQDYLDSIFTRIVLPNEVISMVEDWSNIRRSSHEDSRGIRKRVTGSTLGVYIEEVNELRGRDMTDRRTSSSYNVVSRNNSHFVLGYNGEKGILYFSKRLRTSHMREFGVSKITEIYAALQEIGTTSPEVIIPLVVDRVVRGNKDEKLRISELLEQVAEIRSQTSRNSIPLKGDVFELATMGRYFDYGISVTCDVCGDIEDVKCSNCGELRFNISHRKIVCMNCGTQIESRVVCLQDHGTDIDSLEEVMTLYPKVRLYEVAEQVFSRAHCPRFNRDQESFQIRGANLHVFSSIGQKTVYLLEDIPEFADLDRVSNASEIASAYNVLENYKEKCRLMGQDNCASCVGTRVGPHCFLRLFGLYDARYTPRPHQGHEFGDVALRVTIDGIPDRQMLTLLKSGNPVGHTITSGSILGSQINAQFDHFIYMPQVDLLAVAVPKRLDDELIARLKTKAHQARKKIMFFGANELAQIIAFVSHSKNIPIEEL